MHPYTALLLCFCIILWLFVVDRHRCPKTSVGFLVALTWVLIIGSRPVTVWFDLSQINSLDSLEEGSAVDRTIFLILILAGLIILRSRQFNWPQFASENKWVVLYFIYLGISIFWSDYTFIAFKRWIKDLGNLIMVLLVLTEGKPWTAVKAILVRASYILIPMSVVLVKYFPDISRYYDDWTGRVYINASATNKNMLGMTLTVLALVHLWVLMDAMQEQARGRKILELLVHLTFLVMILWLLNLADCSTALGCIIIGAMFILILRVRFISKNIRVLVTLGIVVGIAISIPYVRTIILEPVVSLLGRDITFTERDLLWQVLLEQKVNPIIGVGSYSFWMGERVAGPLPGLDSWTNSAHNAYLEIYLNVGLIGLALYLGILASSMKRFIGDIAHRENDNGVRFCFVFLIVVILYGVTEAIIRLNLLWFGLLLVVVRAPPAVFVGKHLISSSLQRRVGGFRSST